MIGFDIKEGDYLLVEPSTQIENGNIVLAIHPEEGCTVKKYLKVGDKAHLKPGNSDYPDIPINNGDDRFRMYRIVETRRKR